MSKPNRKATFKVAADEVVTCTFTNSEAATIKIVKETTPVNASDTFNFTSPDLPSSSFSLRGGRESVFSVAAGTYTVTESALTGWDLAGLSCSNGASTTSLAGRTATIVAGSGQTVTCTFLNVKRANITIAKKTDPEGSYQSFGFTSPNLPSSSFSLSDGQTKTMSVAPGTYSVTETTTARWDLVGLVCSNDSSRGDVPTATATIVASAGDNITCTYTNKAQPLPGTVTIRKQTEPAGSSQTFRFTSTNLPQRAFTLGDMQSNTQTVTAGTYRVTESLISGWAVASITCDDRDSSGNPSNGQLIVVVDPGEDVTCTYVNRAADATIVIKKTTLPSVSQQDFTFDGGSLGTFSLRGGQSKTLTVRPGRYQISEDELPGWDLASLFCTDSSARVDGANVTLTVAPASRVTCTYTNAQRGTVTIAKSTAPAGSDEYFQFQSADLPSDSFWLSDGETRTFDVPAGTYRVTEAQVEGWSLTRLVCDSSGSGGSIATRQATIVVPAGRDVTCTWTNSMNATINITKRTEPTGDDTRFGFSTTMGASFTLGDGETKTFSIRPGSYTVTEATKAGWQLTGIECDGATPVLSARRVTINATAGATIDCTYTNDKESAQVIIRKITNPAGASQVFSFSPDSSLGGGDFDLGHGEEKIFDVAPGTFTVSELPTIDSWELQGISCDDSDSTASGLTATIRVKNKETVTCVFTNRPKTASMCGDVFEDIAVNGLKDGEDINIPGSKVLLDLNNNGQADPGEPIVDSSNGTYCFNNLVPGKYRVLVQLPSGGYKCLLPTRCDDSRTIGWGKNPGPPLSAIRTGYATLEGTQFEDKNKDGSPRQPTDPLLPGWKVFVDYNGNGIQDPGEPSAVTDENGFYKISRVRAGRYTLRSIPPASTPYVCTYPQTCSRTAQIVIPPSGLNEVKKQDFGAILPASRRRINIRIAARCQRSGIPVRVAASGARYVVVSLFGRRATDATVDRSGAYSFFFRTPRGTRPGPHRLRIDVRYLGVRTASTRTFYRTASICPPRSKPKFSG